LFDVALREGSQAERMRLIAILGGEPTGQALSETRAVWLLQAAGIDPVPMIARRDAMPPATAPFGPFRGSTVVADGQPTHPFDLERQLRSPPLTQRLALPLRR
jgi:hypothetical protein